MANRIRKTNQIRKNKQKKTELHQDGQEFKKSEKLKEVKKNESVHQNPLLYLNRELSWLEFNSRVLEEAENKTHPILERLRFLSISASNLDEFYMIRVAGLKAQVRNSIITPSQDGLSPSEQLYKINHLASQLMSKQQRIWFLIKEELTTHQVEILTDEHKLNPDEVKWLRQDFLTQILPVITPLAVDPAHPFPFIPNLGFALAVSLKSLKDQRILNTLIPIPQGIKRFIKLAVKEQNTDKKNKRFIALENVFSLFINDLFPGYKLVAKGVFRIIRDSDIEIEDESEDLVREFETALKQRRRGRLVRLKIDAGMADELRDFIIEKLRASKQDVILVEGILGIVHLSQLISDLDLKLTFPKFEPRFPERIREHGGDCFAAIKEKDILVHHPYETFDVVVRFLQQAARDPNVVAIKQTLYRTSHDSPIIDALIEAAESGKNVTALIELQARFDEEANLKWARDLERSGVQVVYGLIAYKTHAKLSLVVRREGEVLKTYTHIGTGNYHPITAKIYTDLALFTANLEIGRDAGRVFNFVSGYIKPQKLERIAISPISLRNKLIEYIEKEIEFAKQGKPAMIWAKMNSLVDPKIIDTLYEASMAGVQIELIIRGICCLKPGIKGLSDHIRVKSIIGRFLEHSRIVCFGNGKKIPSNQTLVFISSADWMPRNLDKRVEVLCPIENQTVKTQLLEQIMLANLKDTEQSWIMDANGAYHRVRSDTNKFNAQNYFMTNPSLSGRGGAIKKSKPVTLKN